MDPLKVYFLLKMGIFQPAMLVYQRVHETQAPSTFQPAYLIQSSLMHKMPTVVYLINLTGPFCIRLPSTYIKNGNWPLFMMALPFILQTVKSISGKTPPWDPFKGLRGGSRWHEFNTGRPTDQRPSRWRWHDEVTDQATSKSYSKGYPGGPGGTQVVQVCLSCRDLIDSFQRFFFVAVNGEDHMIWGKKKSTNKKTGCVCCKHMI